MSSPQVFKVGEAPWETGGSGAVPVPQSYRVGEAPWEVQSAPAQDAPAAPKTSGIDAAIDHFGNGASLGYIANLQALASKPIYAALNAMTGQSVQPDSYVQERDANIARMAQEKADHPYISNASQIAGAIATAPAIEKAVVGIAPKALSVAPEVVKAAAAGDRAAQALVNAARVRRAMTLGGATAAIANPGDIAGRVSPFQLKDRALNAGVGVAMGYGIDKAAQGISNLASSLGEKADSMKSAAEESAVRNVGAQKPQMKALNARNKVGEVGRFIIDNKIAPIGANADQIAENVANVKQQAGDAIEAVYNRIEGAGSAGTFNRQTIAQAMRDALAGDKEVGGSVFSDDVVPRMEKLITSFENRDGAATASEIKAVKGELDSAINYSKAQNELPVMQKGYSNLRSTLNEAIFDRASAIDKTGKLAQALKDANRQYGLASTVEDIVKNKLAQKGNNFFSLTDNLAGAAVGAAELAHGSPFAVPLAIAGAAGTKLARKYGPGIMTAGLDAAGNALNAAAPSAAEAAGAVAPSAVSALEAAGGESAPAARQAYLGGSRPTLPGSGVVGQSPATTPAPSKGPDKWANDGWKNLLEHGRAPAGAADLDAMKERLMADPKGKQLLINASDLKPGSKAMDKIMERIKQRYGAATPGL